MVEDLLKNPSTDFSNSDLGPVKIDGYCKTCAW